MAYLLARNVLARVVRHEIYSSTSCLQISKVSRNLLCSSVDSAPSSSAETHIGDGEKNAPIPEGSHIRRSGNRVTERFFRMKNYAVRKDSLIERLNRELAKGEVLSDKTAHFLLSSCDQCMTSEPKEVRLEIVEHIWSELKANGVELTIQLWNTLLAVYVQNEKDFDPVDFLTRLQEETDVEPNSSTFYLLLQAYSNKGDPVSVIKTMDFMIENGWYIAEKCYGFLVGALLKNGEMERIDEIKQVMNDSGIHYKHSVYLELLKHHAFHGDVPSLEKTFQEMEDSFIDVNEEMYYFVMESFLKGRHVDKLSEIMDYFEGKFDYKKLLFMYLRQCIAQKDYELALMFGSRALHASPYTHERDLARIVENMIYHNLSFFKRDFQEFVEVSKTTAKYLGKEESVQILELISFLSKRSEIDQILEQIKALDQELISHNIFFRIMRNGAEKIEDYEKVFSTMREMNVQPNSAICRYVNEECNKIEDPEEQEKFKQIIQEHEFNIEEESQLSDESILDATFGELNKMTRNIRSKKQIFSNLNQIKEKMLSDDLDAQDEEVERFLRQMLSSILREEVEFDTLEVLDIVKSLMRKDAPLSIGTFDMTLRLLRRNNLDDHMFELLREMDERKVKMDAKLYYYILDRASVLGNTILSQYAFNKIKEIGNFNNMDNVYCKLLNAYVGNNSKKGKVADIRVVQIYQEMILLDYKLKDWLVSRVMDSCLRAGDFESAVNLFEEAVASGKAGTDHYNIIIRGYENVGDYENAQKICNQMENYGVEKNQFTQELSVRMKAAAGDLSCINDFEELIADKNEMRRSTFVTILKQISMTGNAEAIDRLSSIATQQQRAEDLRLNLGMGYIVAHIINGNFQEASTELQTLIRNPNDLQVISKLFYRYGEIAARKENGQFVDDIIDFCKTHGITLYSVNDLLHMLGRSYPDEASKEKQIKLKETIKSIVTKGLEE